MVNPRKQAQDDARFLLSGHAVRATVTNMIGDSLMVMREGRTVEEGPYGRLESYAVPDVGHLVILLVPGSGRKRPVILGREIS